LAWLTIKYFIDKRKENGEGEAEEEDVNAKSLFIRLFGTFWGTVASVELMDIAFSVDSVLAAFGVSNEVWILFLGGILGVLMMRGVAGIFLTLIDRVPELETTAYILIAIISIKMFLSVAHYELEPMYFFIILLFTFGATFIVHFLNKRKKVEQ
jgi:YkoY family integral membrane protein